MADTSTKPTFAETPHPTSSPWGQPQGWEKVIPGVWQCHTASHGGWWLSDERLAAMPEYLKAQTFNRAKQWFEEDSDWALVVRAWPDEFDEETRGHAEQNRLWRELFAARDRNKTIDDIRSASSLRLADFPGHCLASAILQRELGPLTIVIDGCNRIAIVRGYTEAQARIPRDRATRISDCIETGLNPEDLVSTCLEYRIYQPIANPARWNGPWFDPADAPSTLSDTQ
jgi:hypothetical protein